MNFKILKTEKQNNLIQIIGLVLGVVTCIFVGKYALFEYSFDRFHKDTDLIYRTHDTEGMLLGQLAKDNLSYVENYSRLHPCYRGVSVNAGDKVYYENEMYFADGSLFEIFSFPVLEGNAVKALNLKDHLAISESYAKKYFGNENPIGKSILINGAYEKNINYTVGAVFKDIPKNSHIQFNILLSIENILVHKMYSSANAWRWSNYFTYFKTNKLIGKESFAANLTNLANTNGAKEHLEKEVNYSLFTLKQLHFNGLNNYMDNNNKKSHVNMRILIAFVIMLIAWLNYVNISLGAAIKNKANLGVKKVLGASSRILFKELLSKTLLVNTIALCVSAIIYVLLFPFVKYVGVKSATMQPLYHAMLWLIILLIQIVGTFFVSFFIHLLLNRKKLIQLISKKGNSPDEAKSPWITLFVIQFSTSIVLICFSLISVKQVNGLMNVNTGIKTDQVLAIRSANFSFNGDVSGSRRVFEQEVLKIPGVTASTSSSYIPGSKIASYMPTRLSSKTKEENVQCRMNFVGYNYIDLFNHEILAGRNFSSDFPSDGKGVVINESLARAYGFTDINDAIGKEIYWEFRDAKRIVIGVMSDFHQQSADVSIEPTLFQLWNHARGYCLLNIETENTVTTLSEVEKLWEKVHKGNAFNYLWIDKHYNTQFQKWIKHSQIVNLLSLIAIIIACIGLYGLSTMLLGNRMKEIGVRKVNGAKVSEILNLLNKDFIKWVAISFVIACPCAYYVMTQWLQSFAYKTELNWWIFASAGILALGIALLTVSWRSWRAATRNPVEALKYE